MENNNIKKTGCKPRDLSNLEKSKIVWENFKLVLDQKNKDNEECKEANDVYVAIYDFSQKFNLTEDDNKKFYKVAAKVVAEVKKNGNVTRNMLEAEMIKELALKGLCFSWINNEEAKKLQKWFQDSNFAAVATTENILKNILTMYRVNKNFDIITKIKSMKSDYKKNHRSENCRSKELSNQEIGQLFNIDLDNLVKEESVKGIIPFEYESLPDNLKTKVKDIYLFNAIKYYCSAFNNNEANVLLCNKDLNKLYYISGDAFKCFSKDVADKQVLIFYTILKNINQINKDLDEKRLDMNKKGKGVNFSNAEAFDYFIEKFGFDEAKDMHFDFVDAFCVSAKDTVKVENLKDAENDVRYGECFIFDGQPLKKTKKYVFNNSKKSMGTNVFGEGYSSTRDGFLRLIVQPFYNISRFFNLHFSHDILAAIVLLEDPKKVAKIDKCISWNAGAKAFWDNVFDFMKLDDKYKDKKQDIVKAVYSLPDTSILKQEFIRGSKFADLIKEIVDYFKKDKDVNSIFGLLEKDLGPNDNNSFVVYCNDSFMFETSAKDSGLDSYLEKCFKNNDFREIVTNKLILKNILSASRAANQHPLEFIKTQKNIYMENHEGKELSNSEIRILLDFDFLNDEQCKKVIPIKTNDLSNEIKNDISGEYVLNALKAYTSEANTFVEEPNYLNSNPNNRRVFYLLDGESMIFEARESEEYIKDRGKRNSFYNALFNLTVENYSDISKLFLDGTKLEIDLTGGSNKVRDYVLNSKYKENFTEMFKDEKLTIRDAEKEKKTGKYESKEVNLINELNFATPYNSCHAFRSFHGTNLKLAPIYVLNNPIKIVFVKSIIDKSHATFDCKVFSSHLMDMISKRESYKSKIPEILSYLDSESEMAKNIFSLAVEESIYKENSLKKEVLKIKRERIESLGIEVRSDIVLNRASFGNLDDKKLIQALNLLGEQIKDIPAKCFDKIKDEPKTAKFFKNILDAKTYNEISDETKKYIKEDFSGPAFSFLLDKKPEMFDKFIENDLDNKQLDFLLTQDFIKKDKNLHAVLEKIRNVQKKEAVDMFSELSNDKKADLNKKSKNTIENQTKPEQKQSIKDNKNQMSRSNSVKQAIKRVFGFAGKFMKSRSKSQPKLENSISDTKKEK